MWHRFSPDLRNAILAATAATCGEEYLTTQHLLEALAAERDAPAARILTGLGVTPEAVRHALCQTATQEGQNSPEDGAGLALTPQARTGAERAYQIAVQMGDYYIGGEHLLLALIRDPEGSAAGQVLAQTGVTWTNAGQMLMAKQRQRLQPPEGVSVPGLGARRLIRQVRKRSRRIKHMLYGLTHFRLPFLPYILFPSRTRNNPYPFYARIRRSPFYWDTLVKQWIVTGYQDVTAALGEPKLSSQTYNLDFANEDAPPPDVAHEFRRLEGSLGRQMLFLDSPDQPRLRSLVARQFTPRVVARMRDQVQQTTDEILDTFASSSRMEVISDFAMPMPLSIISRMLGVPDGDAKAFKQWSEEYIVHIGGETTLAQDLTAYESLGRLTTYFQTMIRERQHTPREDLITVLLQAKDQGERLTEQEVIDNCLLLLVAGHENTTRLIGSGLHALLTHPDQMRLLLEDPSLIGTAVEEMLRYDSPVQWTSRVVPKPFEWHGRTFEKGHLVRLGLAAANRDPAQFPDPDRFDITRAENRHVAFGSGPHFCLGTVLTRLEAQIALSTLLTRFPNLRLEKPPTQSHASFAFRGLESLHIRWD